MSSPVPHPSRSAAPFLFCALALAALVFGAMRWKSSFTKHPTPAPQGSGAPVVVPTSTQTGEEIPVAASSTPPAAVRARPEGTVCDTANTLCIEAPAMAARITNPFTVSGTVVGSARTLAWRVEDAEETIFASGSAQVSNGTAAEPALFSWRVFFLDALPKSAALTLVVHEERSERANQATEEVRIPLRMDQRTQMTRSLFFISEAAAETTDCTVVKAVRVSLPTASTPIEATLRALLRTDSSDTPAGLLTMIPDRTQLRSLTLANGVATAVFDAGLERDGGGSCRVGGIRAQIEATLKQFSSVQRVDIIVEGKTAEETLQP